MVVDRVKMDVSLVTMAALISVDIEQGHMFRLASEVDPRKGKSKGGFLEGFIELPRGYTELKMVISSHPTFEYPEDLVAGQPQLPGFSPCLLYLVRKPVGRVQYDKMPMPYCQHYRQELIIRDKTVYFKTVTSQFDSEEMQVRIGNDPWEQLFTLKDASKLPLGNAENSLKLQILYPKDELRSKSPEDVTVKKMLQHRGLPTSIASFFTEGSHKANLKQIKVHVNIQGKTKMCVFTTIATGLSHIIKDTKSKENGAFHLYGRYPQMSCSFGGSNICMVSEFPVPKEVRPQFSLRNQTTGERVGEDEEESLLNNQIESTIIRDTIIFKTPPQPRIHEILSKGYKVVLVACRSSDEAVSNHFDFIYEPHESMVIQKDNTTTCLFCNFSQNEELRVPEVAKPGEKKRKMLSTPEKAAKVARNISHDSGLGMLSPDSGFGNSPNSRVEDLSHDDPDDPVNLTDLFLNEDDFNHTMEDVQQSMDNGQNGLFDDLEKYLDGNIAMDGKPRASHRANKESTEAAPPQSVLHGWADILAGANPEGRFLANRCLLVFLLILLWLVNQKTEDRDFGRVSRNVISAYRPFPVFISIVVGLGSYFTLWGIISGVVLGFPVSIALTVATKSLLGI